MAVYLLKTVTYGSDIAGADPEELAPLYQIQAAVAGRVPGSASTLMPPADRLPTLGADALRLHTRRGRPDAHGGPDRVHRDGKAR